MIRSGHLDVVSRPARTVQPLSVIPLCHGVIGQRLPWMKKVVQSSCRTEFVIKSRV